MLIGIGFVTLTVVLVGLYCFVLLLAFFAVRWLKAIVRYYQGNPAPRPLTKEMWRRIKNDPDHRFPEPKPFPRLFIKGDRRRVALVALFVLSLTGFTYLHQRVEWMGEDNAHFTAKEYFVAGQVVYGVRMVLATFLPPDNLLSAPFVRLQRQIYDRGIGYLPENDGERGVWFNNWFVYLFGRRFLAPKDPDVAHYSPRMRAFLEPVWTSIEQVATLPFADRQMEVEQYYRNFPGQVFYYNFKKQHYADKVLGAGRFLTRDPKMVARSRHLVAWLAEMEAKWRGSEETIGFLHKNPVVAVSRQAVLLMELSDVIASEIMTETFSCNSAYLRQYLDLRTEFAGDGTRSPLYRQMRDKRQAQTLYNIAINTLQNGFTSYVAKTYCGFDVAGEEDMSRYPAFTERTPEARKAREIRTLFKDEIIKLEEGKYVVP